MWHEEKKSPSFSGCSGVFIAVVQLLLNSVQDLLRSTVGHQEIMVLFHPKSYHSIKKNRLLFDLAVPSYVGK